MGFFDNILDWFWKKKNPPLTPKIQSPKVEKSEIDVYQSQINELDKVISELKNRPKATRSDNVNWDIIKQSEIEICEISIFEKYSFSEFVTLSFLKKERIRKEKERLAKLALELSTLISKAQLYVNQDNLEKSRELYTAIKSKINDVQDKNVKKQYLKFVENFKRLQEKIWEQERKRREEELKREEEERKRREEAIKREEEERKRIEEERKRREEEARKERERKAQELLAEARRKEAAELAELNRLNAINEQKKVDAEAILRYLNDNGVRCFYHFTDRRNLVSIKKHGGLLSWWYCEQNNVTIPYAGGDTVSRGLDCRHNLQNFVRVSFCDDHPMAFGCYKDGADLVLLKISIEVATFRDTIFCDMNATDNNHSKGTDYNDLLKVNISATREHYLDKKNPYFKPHQAEVMINTFIPIRYILNIDNPQTMNFRK